MDLQWNRFWNSPAPNLNLPTRPAALIEFNMHQARVHSSSSLELSILNSKLSSPEAKTLPSGRECSPFDFVCLRTQDGVFDVKLHCTVKRIEYTFVSPLFGRLSQKFGTDLRFWSQDHLSDFIYLTC
ncbi:hypothetical protein AVEN_110437-1 [Araneus ventricosus]|uniref:Uncharacterized protein n=1 Tax=Araneus ventricosus TaxID=182803 RepID=A0A4Y2KIZ8_ARAVE|nr:hypothetical protein AVEN_110437-1 [Araneus ventricosus]